MKSIDKQINYTSLLLSASAIAIVIANLMEKAKVVYFMIAVLPILFYLWYKMYNQEVKTHNSKSLLLGITIATIIQLLIVWAIQYQKFF
jgi:RsiW-degrading membrane proteinase PrsW (M82 family)